MNAVAEELARKALEATLSAEIERRAAELESGAIQGIPWEEVRKRLTSRR